MSGEHSLLERIEAPARAGRGGDVEASLLLDSVIANLARTFNTRQGDAPARPDYGMPDFNDMASQFPDALAVIARAIRTQIVEFEPRLVNPVVRHVPDPDSPLAIRYHVSAQLVLPGRSERVAVETTLDDSGHMRVGR